MILIIRKALHKSCKALVIYYLWIYDQWGSEMETFPVSVLPAKCQI